ncbi:hypothetical protein [Domibacillus indicus]|uniref:hypothetical protein n=1 Tax=Domibacillus indicus TaxID=1437523 RepID=UPI000A8363D5|nr:hypothetical protein [Domibacillus indicus]
MAYRRTVVAQHWTREEMDMYFQKFEQKRPAYLRKAEQTVGERFSSRSRNTRNMRPSGS